MSAPAKYRKKPVVIEAVEWDGTAEAAGHVIDWAFAGGGSITYHCEDTVKCLKDDEMAHTLAIVTLEGTMHASPGDWIIKGVNGEFYPCKPDIFAKTYAREDTAWPEAEA